MPSGHEMPVLGFGIYMNYMPMPACHAAIEAGYRHIDCAIAYRSEEDVGQVVRECGVKREELFITSKVTSRWHGYRDTLLAIDRSLNKFDIGTDFPTLPSPYLLLWEGWIKSTLGSGRARSGRMPRLQAWRALIRGRNEGLLKTIGVSNYGIHHLEEIKDAGLETPAVNQIEQRTIVEYCKKNNIVIQAYSPLCRAKHLDDKVLVDIAQKHNKEPAQVLIRWSLQKGYSPLPKSSQVERIRSNAQVFDFELSDEDMEALDALDRGAGGATSWNPVNIK
ncbi:hypothetical protein FRB99_002172 [Tulasnella sp. 403]|nr:hypothetical protein FRB99_002172 [Tulasnella sp. 403]